MFRGRRMPMASTTPTPRTSTLTIPLERRWSSVRRRLLKSATTRNSRSPKIITATPSSATATATMMTRYPPARPTTTGQGAPKLPSPTTGTRSSGPTGRTLTPRRRCRAANPTVTSRRRGMSSSPTIGMRSSGKMGRYPSVGRRRTDSPRADRKRRSSTRRKSKKRRKTA